MGRLIFALTLSASGLIAQASAPPPLVHLYPVALGRDGRPVTDLSSSDFKITDQGKREMIYFFRGPHAQEPTRPGPQEYVNRPGGKAPHATAILFDLVDETRPNWIEAWHMLAKPLAEPGEYPYFYVLSLDGALIPVRAIGSKSAGDLDKIMAAASTARPAGMLQEDHVKAVYHDLELLGNQLAALPGRGEIVWITNWVPDIRQLMPCSGDWVDCGLYVAHMAVTLEQDHVQVNPAYLGGELQPQIAYDLEQMALLTGGHVYFREDIPAILGAVARNSAQAYEIDYAPGAGHWDNKFHKVHLRCARKGVKLQVRERYYALPDSRADAERQKDVVVSALGSRADATDIGLRVSVTPEANGVHLEVRIDAADLLLRAEGGKFVGSAMLLISNRGASQASGAGGLLRRPLGEPSVSSFKLELTQEELVAKRRKGIVLSMDHAITRAVERVRVMVIDQGRNAVGSVTFPVL